VPGPPVTWSSGPAVVVARPQRPVSLDAGKGEYPTPRWVGLPRSLSSHSAPCGNLGLQYVLICSWLHISQKIISRPRH
jgi:hypothetical protein